MKWVFYFEVQKKKVQGEWRLEDLATTPREFMKEKF